MNDKGLVCPKCGMPLIQVNEVKYKEVIDCAWICLNPDCRSMNSEYPILYGYTQDDINGNVKT